MELSMNKVYKAYLGKDDPDPDLMDHLIVEYLDLGAGFIAF